MATYLVKRITKFQQASLLQGVKGIWASHCMCLSTDRPDDPNAPPDGQSENKEKVDNVRNEILLASLSFVNQHGWTRNALGAGAEALGYPGVAHGMFPKGGIELIHYFYVSCNQKLMEKMKLEAEQAAVDVSKQKKSTVFIQDALETRLRMITPYLDKWPQAIGIMALPPNVPTTLANLLTLVDDVCYYAGDRSVDFNWYSRRIAIAGVYKVTELCLLQDKSEDHKETWQFLAHRIEDVEYLLNYVQHSGEFSQVAKEAVTSAFITARNILGLTLGNR